MESEFQSLLCQMDVGEPKARRSVEPLDNAAEPESFRIVPKTMHHSLVAPKERLHTSRHTFYVFHLTLVFHQCLYRLSTGEGSANHDISLIFTEIVGLEVGEAIVFSSSSIVKGSVAVKDAETTKKKREVIRPEDIVPEKLGIG